MKKNQRLKIAFLTFFGIAALGILWGVGYLESATFADSIKQMISERSPQKLGIVGDFSNLKLHLLPPAIGVENPKIRVERENISKLAIEGTIEAKEMRVSFAPIQMLSGTLQISEVAVIGGAVEGKIGADTFKVTKKPKASISKLSWKDLFQLQINGVRFEDTYLNVQTEIPQAGGTTKWMNSELVVKHLDVSKSAKGNKALFTSSALVNAVRVDFPQKWINLPIPEANQLQWSLELSDEGLKLLPFTAEFQGTTLSLVGKITGNVLEGGQDLQLSGEAELDSELSNFDDWGGEAQAKAKFSAALADFRHTFKGTYDVKGRELSWKNMHASTLTASGAVDLAHQKVEVKNLAMTDESDPKTKGSLKIESTSIPLNLNEPFQTKVALEGADIHWLGGVVLSAVYALEGKVSGTAGLQFVPEGPKNWNLKVQDTLSVAQFALTNQKLGTPRPKNYILRPPLPILVSGGLNISPNGLDFKGTTVKIKKSSFDVTGGVHSKEGFDFTATGDVDLGEVNEIASQEIRGAGKLVAHIHGPSSGVILDFDMDGKQLEYLKMLFGDVKGRITYDDGISELRFSQVKAQQRSTSYSLEQGRIDLNGSDEIHLPIVIKQGRIEDLGYILGNLAKKVSWYPYALKGDVRGNVDVGGKIDTPRLQIFSQLEGSDWIWLGEKARRVNMNVGYDRGNYFAKSVSIIKTNGEIKGNIEFNANNDEMKWDMSTANLNFGDIDFVDRLEIPAKSKIEIKSTGSGKMDHLKSKTEGRIYASEIKGEPLEPTHFNIEVGESNLRANLNVFGSSFEAQLKYSLLNRQPSNLKVVFKQFDFSPALLMINPKLLDDPELHGSIDGKLQLDFLSSQAELARGDIEVSSYSLTKTGFKFWLADPIKVPIQLGYFTLNPTRLKFNNSELKVSGEGKRGDVDIHVEGKSDLSIAELFSSSIQKVRGTADTDMRIWGPLKELKVNGDLSFSNAYALMSWMQTPFEELDGKIHVRQGMIYVDSMEAYLGDEVFALSGRIETFADRFPSLDLRAQFEDNKIKMPPLEFVQPRGVATIKGLKPPYLISGNVDVLQGLWTKSFGGTKGTAARGDRFAPRDQDSQLGSSIFNLDLNVTANQAFYIRNEIIDAEFKGKARLIGPPDNPKILGEGHLVQGKVLFRDRPFIFESVKVEFDDPYQLNPKFSAAAVSEVNQYKIRVLAYGRSDSWKAEFSSSPFLPENEIYSLLATGLTTSETNRFKSKDRSYVDQGTAASMILHSLDFSKDVQSKTGLQFDVQEAVDLQQANSAFRPQSLNENVASPKVVLRRQLGTNIGLSFGSTVGVGSQNQREVNAEYSLSKRMSVLGVWNNIEDVTNRDTRTSFGLDLKFNKKFK